MINLLSAATSTPKHAFKTTDLSNALMHKLSPELINTLNSLGVDQRYSVMDNYPDFLAGKPMNARSSTTELGVGATKRCIEEWQGDPSRIGLIRCFPVWPRKSWDKLTDSCPDHFAPSACKLKAVRCYSNPLKSLNGISPPIQESWQWS